MIVQLKCDKNRMWGDMQPWVGIKTCATAQPLYTGCTLQQLSYRDASIHNWENVWFVGQLSSISIKINTDQTKNLLLIEIQTQHNCVCQFFFLWLPACSSHTLWFCSFLLVWDTGGLLLNHGRLYCAPVITALNDPADPNCHLLEDSCCLVFGLSDLEMFCVWCFQSPFLFTGFLHPHLWCLLCALPCLIYSLLRCDLLCSCMHCQRFDGFYPQCTVADKSSTISSANIHVLEN